MSCNPTSRLGIVVESGAAATAQVELNFLPACSDNRVSISTCARCRFSINPERIYENVMAGECMQANLCLIAVSEAYVLWTQLSHTSAYLQPNGDVLAGEQSSSLITAISYSTPSSSNIRQCRSIVRYHREDHQPEVFRAPRTR